MLASVNSQLAPVGFGAFCTLDSLTAYKRRLISPWTNLNNDLVDCPGITLAQKTAWRTDYAAFQSWYGAALPLCDADAEIREGQDFETRLAGWYTIVVAAGCQPTDPPLAPLPSTDPKSINYVPPESTTIQTIKTVATAGAILGGAVALVYGLKLAGEVVERVPAHAVRENPLGHATKTRLLIGGGALAIIGGVVVAVSSTAKAVVVAATEEQHSTPLPSSSQQTGSKTITYRTVPIQYGTDWDTPGNWIALWTINGQNFGAEKRTNESGIVEYVEGMIDAYFAKVGWVPLDAVSGFTMQTGSTYRVSLPSTATGVALPFLNGSSVSFSALPADWPATDQTDATRIRGTFVIPVGGTAVVIPATPGALAWVLVPPS